jgi:hypothetical protein
MVLMAVADPNYRSEYVDISRWGKDCDSTIFKRSSLWTFIQINMLKLPSEKAVLGTEGQNVPYFFVGDEGFALNRNIRCLPGDTGVPAGKNERGRARPAATRHASEADGKADNSHLVPP